MLRFISKLLFPYQFLIFFSLLICVISLLRYIRKKCLAGDNSEGDKHHGNKNNIGSNGIKQAAEDHDKDASDDPAAPSVFLRLRIIFKDFHIRIILLGDQLYKRTENHQKYNRT